MASAGVDDDIEELHPTMVALPVATDAAARLRDRETATRLRLRHSGYVDAPPGAAHPPKNKSGGASGFKCSANQAFGVLQSPKALSPRLCRQGLPLPLPGLDLQRNVLGSGAWLRCRWSR